MPGADRRSTSARVPLYEQVAQASSCQNEVILPWTKDKIEDKTFPAARPGLRGGDQAARPASPARAARATPTASGSASCSRTPNFAYPMRDRQVLPHRPAAPGRQPADAAEPRPPAAARPTCRARPSSRRTCARARRRRRRASTSRSRRPPPRRRPLQKTVDWLRKDLKAERLLPQGLRRAGHREGARRSEDARSASTPATSPRSSGSRSSSRWRRRLHRSHNQRLRFPWEGKPFKLQGRVLHRAGRHARPGPDRARLGRARRRHHQGRRSRTAAPIVTMDARPRVQGPRPHRRHRAAAAQDRAEGHVHRARPGHRTSAPLAKAGWTLPVSNTLPDVNPDEIYSPRWTPTRATT